MRTAAQVEPEVDQRGWHPLGPSGQRRTRLGRVQAILQRHRGVVMHLDAGVERVRQGEPQTHRAGEPDQHAFPKLDLQHERPIA